MAEGPRPPPRPASALSAAAGHNQGVTRRGAQGAAAGRRARSHRNVDVRMPYGGGGGRM